MQKISYLFAIALTSLFAFPALASTLTPMENNSILILIVLVALIAINAVAQLSCYLAGLYVQKCVAYKHAAISLLFPLMAFIGFIIEYQSLAQFTLYLGTVLLGCGAALIPLALTNKKAPSNHSALILLTAAIIILPLSIIAAPLSLFTITLCHLALKQAQVTPFAKIATVLTLVTGYGLLLYWLFQLFNQMAGL
ncbi:hypothetical protein [Shewanella donghaensis]|uniref:hypothetical protein n=1 Tax=Shewanella donghaensis TaxID=238836 RepID=UPI001183D3E4|nr:hypothetical protein [Shewanella donghaensis]